MKIECGTDIIEIGRIKEAIEKGGMVFLNKIFSPLEQEYCEQKRTARFQSYAVRFAAKEAVCKAFGTGMTGVFFNEIEVVCDSDSGKPHVVFYGRAKKLFESYDGASLSISLSHSESFANAIAVLLIPVKAS